MTLEKIISELHYTNRVKQDVLWKIRRDEKLIDELAKTAYQSDSFDFRCANVCRLPVYLSLHIF